MIIELVGNPPKEVVDQIHNPKNKEFIESFPKTKGKDFKTLFKGANPDAIDLLQKLLIFDPKKRITIEEALEHPYMSQLHFKDDEPTTDLVSAFDFDFELYSLKKEEFKDLIYEEIMLYHDEKSKKEYEKNKESHPNGILNKRYSKDRIRKKYRS